MESGFLHDDWMKCWRTTVSLTALFENAAEQLLFQFVETGLETCCPLSACWHRTLSCFHHLSLTIPCPSTRCYYSFITIQTVENNTLKTVVGLGVYTLHNRTTSALSEKGKHKTRVPVQWAEPGAKEILAVTTSSRWTLAAKMQRCGLVLLRTVCDSVGYRTKKHTLNWHWPNSADKFPVCVLTTFPSIIWQSGSCSSVSSIKSVPGRSAGHVHFPKWFQ